MINNCLITGAQGFLGHHIVDILMSNGFDVDTIGRSARNLIHCDLSIEVPVLSNGYDLVIHCAGKAHLIPKTEEERRAFFEVNVQGTKNLLKSLENTQVNIKSFVFISSVSVYGKHEGFNLNEKTPLQAVDPYGLSKIQAETLILDWCKLKGVNCTILRLPLLVGINPPGNLAAMIKGIKKGYYFNIGGGTAKKSMVFAKDVAKIIPKAATVGGIYNLTDGYNPSFKELSELIARQTDKRSAKNLPYVIAKILAAFGDFIGNSFPLNNKKLRKIVMTLTFDDSHARKKLGWNPTRILDDFKI